MKKNLLLLFCLPLFFISCGKKPEANFTWSPTNPKAGVEMQFTNTSIDAKKYDWNFGDMSVGKEKDPKHTYSNAGDYIIDLNAHNGLSSDVKTVTITVVP
jgi:PKD repeat protein